MTDGTPDEQTVERVAKAMYLARYEEDGGDWSCVADRAKADPWGVMARAAIAAMTDTKALEAADGRPCETDIFLVCLFDQVEDHYDREAAIKDWLEGAWSEALDGVELPDRAARGGKA